MSETDTRVSLGNFSARDKDALQFLIDRTGAPIEIEDATDIHGQPLPTMVHLVRTRVVEHDPQLAQFWMQCEQARLLPDLCLDYDHAIRRGLAQFPRPVPDDRGVIVSPSGVCRVNDDGGTELVKEFEP